MEINSMRIIRIGIIGCGSIAQVHGWALQKTDNVNLVSCTDIEIQRAQVFAEQYTGLLQMYGRKNDL